MENERSELNKSVTLCSDGKYRWVYEMSLLKNPTVFILIWKIFFFIILGIFVVTNITDMISWSDYFPGRFLENLKFIGITLLVMTALTLIGYLIYAAIMGGKYIVEFEMDENGILHRQTESQAKKARKIGRAAATGGIAARNLTMVGAGINSTRTEMYSDFSKTKKVKAYPRRELIKVNGLLDRNQVYVPKDDFEFVKNYITEHCPNLK